MSERGATQMQSAGGPFRRLLLTALLAPSLSLVACGDDPPEMGTDGGPGPIDHCNPPDLVGACPPRGVFDDSVEVELKAPEESDAVHFTLDGSEPTASSPRYQDTLTITPDPARGGAVTLRAVAFHQDGSRTRSVTHTYIFPDSVLEQPALPAGHPDTWGFGNSTREGDYEMDARAFADATERDQARAALADLASVSITVDHDDLWAPTSGIYMRPSASGADFIRPAEVEILFPDGESVSRAIGLSIQGNSSTTNWKSAKLSMRLRFRGDYGGGDLSAALFADSGVTSFANLVLDAHLNNTWIHPDLDQRQRALYVGDQYVARLLNATGSLAPHSTPVHLYLNGIYWGLYDLHERADEHFAAAYLGGNADDFDVIRHGPQTIINGDRVAWDEMMAIARAGLADNGRYQQLSAMVDTDDLINYMLINFYAGNDDWDHHNWYAARDRAGGQFRFFSWDAEHVLKDVNVDVTGVANPDAPSELYQALLDAPEFRTMLAARAAELYASGGALFVNPDAPSWDPSSPENNRPAFHLNELIAPIGDAILLESARWGDNRSPDAPHLRSEWQGTTQALFDSYFPARSEAASAQIPTP